MTGSNTVVDQPVRVSGSVLAVSGSYSMLRPDGAAGYELAEDGLLAQLDVCLLNEDGSQATMCPGNGGSCSEGERVPACRSFCGFAGGSPVDCLSLDFGVASVGCKPKERTVRLFNNGFGSLNVFGLASGPSPEFRIASVSGGVVTPFEIPPYSSVSVRLQYMPPSEGADAGKLVIYTDSPYPSSCEGDPEVCRIEMNLKGQGRVDRGEQDVFHFGAKPKVDVLFCVDNSASMAGYQDSLSSALDTFINFLKTADVDFHIAVVTSQVDSSGYSQSGDPITPGVFFSKNGYPRIIANYPPNPPEAPFLPVVPKDKIADAFKANATPGTCCADPRSACMEAVQKALSDPLIYDAAANKGFLRKYASLLLIMVGDGDDQSSSPVDYYGDYLKGIKGPNNKSLFKLSVVAELDGDFDPSYPNAFPSAKRCDPWGTGVGGVRYLDLWKKIYDTHKNGIALSICDADWGDRLIKPYSECYQAPAEFFLTRPVNPASLKVMLNGTELFVDPVNGYTYDPNNNSLILGSKVDPPLDSVLVVDYGVECG